MNGTLICVFKVIMYLIDSNGGYLTSLSDRQDKKCSKTEQIGIGQECKEEDHNMNSNRTN